MGEKYYVDTCIWRDYYENREGIRGRPLGFYATRFFMYVIKGKHTIIFSNHIISELTSAFDIDEINNMFKILELMNILEKVKVRKEDLEEARKLEIEKVVSRADALHAILARNNSAIMVTQNIKDFEKFKEFVVIKRPEEIV